LRDASLFKTLFEQQDYDPQSFFLIAGPCVVESEDVVMEVASSVKAICYKLGIPLVFKASYRKATAPAQVHLQD
jgi:2-dehydro-3-deoxyphosphooctonate aldolase (KDO 8-P synthase)